MLATVIVYCSVCMYTYASTTEADPVLPDCTHEDYAAALDATVAEMLAAAKISAPPIDAFRVAAALGVVVASDDRQAGRARYARLVAPSTFGIARSPTMPQPQASAQPSIFLRREPRAERRQWAVGHELGEHVAEQVFRRLAIEVATAPPTARETVANQLAGRLLVPTRWFVADIRRYAGDLVRLKARYATASHELIARRMLDLEPFSIITIWDQRRVTFRQSNSGGSPPRPCPAELDCWRAVHEQAEPAERSTQGLHVAGWPVHEPGWKREILRSTPDPTCQPDYAE